MATPTFVLATEPPPQRCGARRGPKSKTLCELPPDHIVGRNHRPHHEINHTGRDTNGRWQSWSPHAPTRPVPRVLSTQPRRSLGFLETERMRDDLVKQVWCPVCGAQPRWRCYGEEGLGRRAVMSVSHTGRYLVAVEAGLVPPLAGSWTG